MKYYFYILFITLIISSCYSAKKTIVVQGDKNKAFEIAVNDFLDNCKLRKTDSVFSVNVYIDNEEIFGLSISPRKEYKICPTLSDKLGAKSIKFPTDYIEKNNKLVFWYSNDSANIITKEVVDVLSHYNQIDSTFINEHDAYPDYPLDESIKGVHYYFCKNNLAKYKRVITNV